MKLFAQPKKKSKKRPRSGPPQANAGQDGSDAGAGSALDLKKQDSHSEGEERPLDFQNDVGELAFAETFAELGVCPWLVESLQSLGMRRPTPVQRACVPAALMGCDVMGLAETGSGKTAAFALPILQKLSEDPYGVFALVLSPTRELCIQIAEQIAALGAPLDVNVCTVIGGVNLTQQALEVAARPHVIVATPGRLLDHLESPQPPALGRLAFLVLDEADRVLATGFAPELARVLKALPNNKAADDEANSGGGGGGGGGHRSASVGYRGRQTLLFSATMSGAIEKLRRMAASKDARLFDLTNGAAGSKTPAALSLEYLFMPAQVKLTFLIAALHKLVKLSSVDDAKARVLNAKAAKGANRGRAGKGAKAKRALAQAAAAAKEEEESTDDEGGPFGGNRRRARSAIIFVGTCARCQEVAQVLAELGVDAVALHSLLDQRRRLASLAKFKAQSCKLLIATDVASRGLDIPDVDLVVHYDMPRLAVDFVHRSGRTARAGRRGRCLSLVTQHDVELVHACEEHVERKLELYEGVTEESVLPLLNPVAKAQRVARQRLSEVGFDDQVAKLKDRAAKRRAYLEKQEDGPAKQTNE